MLKNTTSLCKLNTKEKLQNYECLDVHKFVIGLLKVQTRNCGGLIELISVTILMQVEYAPLLISLHCRISHR